MVNNSNNISAYQGMPPSSAGDRRNPISGGPLYQPEEVLALLDKGDDQTVLWTRKCKNDVQVVLAYEMAEVRSLVREAITQGRYINSEWCVQKPTGPWAACDSYKIERSEWVEHAHKDMRIEYYVKFAIGKTGKILLLVSCHLSQ